MSDLSQLKDAPLILFQTRKILMHIDFFRRCSLKPFEHSTHSYFLSISYPLAEICIIHIKRLCISLSWLSSGRMFTSWWEVKGLTLVATKPNLLLIYKTKCSWKGLFKWLKASWLSVIRFYFKSDFETKSIRNYIGGEKLYRDIVRIQNIID